MFINKHGVISLWFQLPWPRCICSRSTLCNKQATSMFSHNSLQCSLFTRECSTTIFYPITVMGMPWGLHDAEARQSAYKSGKVVSPTNRQSFPPGNSFISIRCWVNPRDIVRPEGLCQMTNSNDTIRNLTHVLPTCSAVPQSTAPPLCPDSNVMPKFNFYFKNCDHTERCLQAPPVL